ncbi:MAG: two-component sensor histidine kinase [Desulfobacteraceae bacterium]|nr:two-component sensor histidine kinase [Desulfobacteraceae bacterium]
MNSNTNPERAKPFRLVKYFSFSSLILIFIFTIVLSMLTTHWIRSMQYTKSEDYAHLLIENLNHQVFMQFFLPIGLKYGKIELRNQKQFELMDKVVRSAMHSFNVEIVNIYGLRDIIAYSFSKEIVGLENFGGVGHMAALEGQPSSKLIQKGAFWELFLGVPKEIKIITFAPLRAEKLLTPATGPIIGVVEIVQDLSNDNKRIFRFQILAFITVSTVMFILFAVMTFVVKRGEGIIQKRAQEELKLKEQLSKAKHLSSIGEMVAGISHEIRNPLGIISSSAELLKKKMAPDHNNLQINDIIIEESVRLNAIITDFLNYARPKTPTRYACHIEDIVSKNIKFLSSQIKKNGYHIQILYEPDLPEIKADADMLYQAFLNILINSMQAMPNGGEITIMVKAKDNHLWIRIDDQGEGIAKNVLDKIWDPFYTTKDKGTGLGLGIVKKVIEAHGGGIQLENRLQGGVRVTIWLPVREN